MCACYFTLWLILKCSYLICFVLGWPGVSLTSVWTANCSCQLTYWTFYKSQISATNLLWRVLSRLTEMFKGIFRIGLGVIKKCQFFFHYQLYEICLNQSIHYTYAHMFFCCVPQDSQSKTLLDLGTTSLLHAYRLILWYWNFVANDKTFVEAW